MGRPLESLSIKGFKSIAALDPFQLHSLNVMIGANGAGKSNFVDFFRLLRAMADEGLQDFVLRSGGGDGFFFLGPKQTPQISARMEFGANSYSFVLAPTDSGSMMVQSECPCYEGHGHPSGPALESGLKRSKDQESDLYDGPGVGHYVYEAISSWTVYHFHDTSRLAPMRREQPIADRKVLREDASNIAAFLLGLRNRNDAAYDLIRDAVQLIAPFFDDFLLVPETKGAEERVKLDWRQRGSDFPLQPHHLSDGTIRFICLATALQQPDPPATVVIDEPELGLHPYALAVLGGLIRSAAERTQVIVSTQSPTLLDHFEPQDVIIVNRQQGRSTFQRVDEERLSQWLQEYTVGELWQKNVVDGGPAVE